MLTHPLSDNAILLDFGNVIRRDVNLRVIQFCEAAEKNPFPGFLEAVPAYSSAAILYDPILLHAHLNAHESVFEKVVSYLERYTHHHSPQEKTVVRHLKIPVCYASEYGHDIPEICDTLNMTPEDIIRIHTSRTYHVYMMGFLPGFPYMGEIEELLFLPRKNSPVQVSAGSVGIAGQQTGIYPLDSPGGWHILGRTPLRLFDPHEEDPVFFKAGDSVSFYPISKDEFDHYPSRHS